MVFWLPRFWSLNFPTATNLKTALIFLTSRPGFYFLQYLTAILILESELALVPLWDFPCLWCVPSGCRYRTSYIALTIKDFVYLNHDKVQCKQTFRCLNIKKKNPGMSILTAFLTNDSIILLLSDSALSTTSIFPFDWL